jgi:hypothetical protein
MWNIKCVNVPAITGVTGLVTEGLKKNFEAIAADRSIDPLQQTASCTWNTTDNTESAAV